MKSISNTALGDLVITIPHLTDQQRIVGILDEAFDGIDVAIAHATESLQKSATVVQAAFTTLVTKADRQDWLRTSIKDAAQAKRGSIRTGPFGVNFFTASSAKQGFQYSESTT